MDTDRERSETLSTAIEASTLISQREAARLLESDVQLGALHRRLERAHGQLGAVVRMVDDGATCEELVAQIAAVSEAVNVAAFTLISASLTECLANPTVASAPLIGKFHKLFLSMA